MDPADAQAMITDATEAICAAHDAGLAHLRLKPGHRAAHPGGQVKIFGLCIEAARHSTTAGRPGAQGHPRPGPGAARRPDRALARG